MGFVLTSTAIVMQIIEERGVAATRAGAAPGRDPAARGPGDRAAAGHRRPARAGGRGRHPGRALGRRRRRPRHARRAGRGRLLAPQPAVPGARPIRGARDHDGGGPPGRARRGAPDAARRPVDGDGRLPGRGAALGIDLPPPARGRDRAVPRPAARPVLPRRRHGPRPERHRHRLALGAALGAGLHGLQGGRHLRRGPADRRGPPRSRLSERPHGPGRRVRLRALQQRRRRRHLRRAHERHLHHGGDRLDGADAAGDGRRHPADRRGPRSRWREWTSPTGWSAACS